jgi:hypothetical protein
MTSTRFGVAGPPGVDDQRPDPVSRVGGRQPRDRDGDRALVRVRVVQRNPHLRALRAAIVECPAIGVPRSLLAAMPDDVLVLERGQFVAAGRGGVREFMRSSLPAAQRPLK